MSSYKNNDYFSRNLLTCVCKANLPGLTREVEERRRAACTEFVWKPRVSLVGLRVEGALCAYVIRLEVSSHENNGRFGLTRVSSYKNNER